MNSYRRPAGQSPYRQPHHNHNPSRMAAFCVLIILGGMIILSLLALDRAASRVDVLPAAHHHQMYAEVSK